MKAVVSVSLSLVFVGLATLNVVSILESSRSAKSPRTRARAKQFTALAAISSSAYSR